MARLRLSVLGGFRAELLPGPGLTLSTRKAQALLAYLALRPGESQLRDKLAALLWADVSDDRARDSLRHTLAAVRRVLARARCPALRVDQRTVALDPAHVEVDALAFERHIEEGRPEALARAAAFYRGDLLEGFVVDAPPFEEWLLTERERLRELALEAFAKLLAHQTRAGLTDRAIQTALRLLALDPLQEPVHRALMRLYVRQGRRAPALRQYQMCVSVLERELGVEPEAETRRLYQEILQRPHAAAASGPLPAIASSPEWPGHETALIGREPELARVREALSAAVQGHGRLLVVGGVAGVGKTRLVDELAGHAVAQGTRVLLGRAYESEQTLPFAPWVDALRRGGVTTDQAVLESLEPVWRAELVRLLPELAAPDLPGSSEDPRRLFEGIGRLLRTLAGGQPLVVLLEDFHWADDMSSKLAAFVGRRLARWPALVVLTVREEEELPVALGQALDELACESHVSQLALGPLSRADTSALVRLLARGIRDDAALAHLQEQVWTASEGNPFMVVETMRVRDEGKPSLTPGGLPLPERVRRVILRRVERLSERGAELAAVAAVIGREFDFALLERASGVGEREAAGGVEELVRRRVLHGRGDHFEFTHDRIREVVYAELMAPRRRLLHRQVVEALEQVYPDRLSDHVDLLAHHALRAESWAKAVRHLRQAGITAFARSANREAVAYFERALDALEHLPQGRERTEQAVDLRFDVRTALVAVGDLDRIFVYLREAERLSSRLEDRRRLGWVSVYLAHYFVLTGQLAEARAYAERARIIAETQGELALRVSATHYLGWVRLNVGDFRGADDSFRTVVGMLEGDRMAERCGLTGFPAVMARWLLALSLAERGEFGEALAHGHEAIRIAEGLDHAFSLILACSALASVHGRKGELSEAATLYERALAICREWNIGLLSPHVMAWLGITYARSHRSVESLQLLEQAVKTFEESSDRVFHSFYVAYQGEAYMLAGRVPEAHRLAERALTLARERGERGSEAWALHLLAETAVRGDPAHVETAEGHYRHALALAEELGMRPSAARCHLGLGELYARLGKLKAAASELAAATDAFRAMGMTSWLLRAEAVQVRLTP
jgi:DNA-binding SARP family transcriptional activator